MKVRILERQIRACLITTPPEKIKFITILIVKVGLCFQIR